MSKTIVTELQHQFAQRLYSSRGTNYDDSWHPEHSRKLIAHARLRRGDRVLDLCCGTGLAAFLAAEAVGDEGEVVGVDVTEGMLRQLRERQAREPALGRRIRTALHDATDLDALAGDGGLLARGSFDAILCSCAFVFFHEPGRVVAHWREFLKPGGVMVIDCPHERNYLAPCALENVARGMGMAWPSHRSWIKSRESFKDMMEAQGMQVEGVFLCEDVSRKGTQVYGVEDADMLFEKNLESSYLVTAASDEFKIKARPLFRAEWEKMAVDGKIEQLDCYYLYVARKTE